MFKHKQVETKCPSCPPPNTGFLLYEGFQWCIESLDKRVRKQRVKWAHWLILKARLLHRKKQTQLLLLAYIIYSSWQDSFG